MHVFYKGCHLLCLLSFPFLPDEGTEIGCRNVLCQKLPCACDSDLRRLLIFQAWLCRLRIIIIIIKRCLPHPVACTNRLNTLHKRTSWMTKAETRHRHANSLTFFSEIAAQDSKILTAQDIMMFRRFHFSSAGLESANAAHERYS